MHTGVFGRSLVSSDSYIAAHNYLYAGIEESEHIWFEQFRSDLVGACSQILC